MRPFRFIIRPICKPVINLPPPPTLAGGLGVNRKATKYGAYERGTNLKPSISSIAAKKKFLKKVEAHAKSSRPQKHTTPSQRACCFYFLPASVVPARRKPNPAPPAPIRPFGQAYWQLGDIRTRRVNMHASPGGARFAVAVGGVDRVVQLTRGRLVCR